MTRRLKARVRRQRGAFLETFMAAEEPIARAATRAIAEAGDGIKRDARAQIGAAGFGRRWQNALRVDHYPKGGEASVNAAAHVWHRIPYAGVFEEGATIGGSPWLWLPLSHAPRKIGRFRMTPKRYTEGVGPLQVVRRPGRAPLLVAQLGLSRAKARKGGKITLAAAKKGLSGGGKHRVIRSVPMFVGISTVRIARRFRITRIIGRAANRLGALYFKHLRADE